MKPKAVIKITADIVMTLALLFLMGYQLWGEAAHEWVGAAMFVLFIFHHILNFGFCKNIFKGKYTPVRILRTITDFLVLVDMIMLMYSGIVMSRHVFAFLPIESGMALARRLHILGSYWGFALMSLHLGLHREFFAMIVKKKSEHYPLKSDRLWDNYALLRVKTLFGVGNQGICTCFCLVFRKISAIDESLNSLGF